MFGYNQLANIMRNLLNIIGAILMVGCTTLNSITNEGGSLYTIENSDDTITKVKSDTTGSLNNKDYENLKNYLTDITQQKINFDKKVIINFIDNDPKTYRKNYQVPWDIFYGNMENDLTKLGECNHFWIINQRVKDLDYYHGDKINWVVDKNNLIRQSFFKYDGLNGGFVIIKPNGDYFLKIGEYRKSDVLNTHNEFK